MKAAFVAWGDPRDINFASGTPYFIYKTLLASGIQAEIVELDGLMNTGPDKAAPGGLTRAFQLRTIAGRALIEAKNYYYNRLNGKIYLKEFDPLVMAWRARRVEERLAAVDHDIVFAWSNHFTALLQSAKPLVMWNDYTFAGYMDIYPPFANLCSRSIKHGHAVEELTLKNSSLVLYSSEWAAKSALENYAVDPAKVKVVPFGPNLNCNRSRHEIEKIAASKNFDRCRLLFLGVDWHTKNGDLAVAVAERLNQRGLKTELHIAGCNPPGIARDFVRVHGFISKESEQGIRHLEKLFSESHFLILPSRNECFGIVFAEASSFGLPSLATSVGGIPTAVRDGRNGRLFSPADEPDQYCAYIEKIFASKESYGRLASSTFGEYEDRLNWSVSGRKVRELIGEYCVGRRHQ